MNATALIFGLEDDLDDQESIIAAFKAEGLFNYEFFANIGEFIHLIKRTPNARVVVIDYNLPGGTGQEVLDQIKGIIKKLKATIISGVITPKMSVDLALSGANDCVVKENGWEKRLAKIVKRHVAEAEQELEEERIESQQKENTWQEVKTLLSK